MINATDSDIQKLPFSLHLPNDGSQIGGVQPATYGLTQSQKGPLSLFVSGAAYSTAEAYINRPWLWGTSLQADFDVTWDQTISNLQITETDILLISPVTGRKYNLSLQLNFNEGGQFQVATPTGWIDVPGAKPGIPTPGTYHYTVTYKWDETANTSQVATISFGPVGGVMATYSVPANLAIPGVASTWAKGALFQLQSTLNASPALPYALIQLDNLKLTWVG